MATQTAEQSVKDILKFQIKNNIKQYSMFIALIGIWLIFHFLTNGIFISPRNMSNLLLQTSYIAVLAVGMVLVIVAGHIDLSVGSIAGFVGAIAAILQVNFGWNTIFAVAAALLVGLLIGVWQGYWIAYREIPAFIVTLSGMTVFRGALIAVTQGATIAPLDESFRMIGSGYLPRIFPQTEAMGFHDTTIIVAILFVLAFIFMILRSRKSRIKYGFQVLPMSLEIAKLVLGSIGIMVFFSIMILYRGIPYSILIVTALVIGYTFLANNTVFGRHVYAMGGNKEAAKLSGINTKLRNLWIFISMGFLCSVSGIIFTARLNAAASSAGTLFELDTIAAAIIGGTSTLGGEGTVFGAIIGALLMASINNGMSLMNISSDWQMIFRGLILLLAVWFDISSRRKSS